MQDASTLQQWQAPLRIAGLGIEALGVRQVGCEEPVHPAFDFRAARMRCGFERSAVVS